MDRQQDERHTVIAAQRKLPGERVWWRPNLPEMVRKEEYSLREHNDGNGDDGSANANDQLRSSAERNIGRAFRVGPRTIKNATAARRPCACECVPAGEACD